MIWPISNLTVSYQYIYRRKTVNKYIDFYSPGGTALQCDSPMSKGTLNARSRNLRASCIFHTKPQQQTRKPLSTRNAGLNDWKIREGRLSG